MEIVSRYERAIPACSPHRRSRPTLSECRFSGALLARIPSGRSTRCHVFPMPAQPCTAALPQPRSIAIPSPRSRYGARGIDRPTHRKTSSYPVIASSSCYSLLPNAWDVVLCRGHNTCRRTPLCFDPLGWSVTSDTVHWFPLGRARRASGGSHAHSRQ